jgi:hypothetical protein
MKRAREDRLSVVLGMARRLATFRAADGTTVVDLYRMDVPAMRELKAVFSSYVNMPDTAVGGMAGSIKFPDIGRTIHYSLPLNARVQPTLLLRA